MNDKSVEQLMSMPDAPLDGERALSRIRERIEREQIRPHTVVGSAAARRQGPLVSMWLKGVAAAASVALVAVPITSADFMSVAGFGRYGTLTWSVPSKPYDVPDLATAKKDSGLTVLTPSQLPAGVSIATVRYGVMPRTTATFTFSAAEQRSDA